MFVISGTVLIAIAVTVSLLAHRSRRTEVSRLTELLSLRQGMTVAEIGAGTGWLTVEVARRVGQSGRVYSTELNADRLNDIRRAVVEAQLPNVTVLEAGEQATHLPPECCDAVFMRRVYHHLTAPAAILASIHEGLRLGGRLAIIDFRPDGLVGRITRMGVDRSEVIRAASAIGFELVASGEWPGVDHYVVVFRKGVDVGRRTL
ncbi:MAG: methyltransferase domain-containing protein [Acidobacteria bacterium]|nr:methyltransferase domain-containing protein [Acidobacteriota bacterium]